MQPVNEDLLHLFRERGALLEGHFLLTSGLHSPRYLQCARVLMDPAVATRLGAELAARVRALLGGVVPGAVVAPALGGVLVAHEVARALGCRGLFSTREVMDAVRARGARVLAVGSLVDRSGGTVDLGVPRASLLSLEVPTWAAEECPLCTAGSKPEKPGSRPSR